MATTTSKLWKRRAVTSALDHLRRVARRTAHRLRPGVEPKWSDSLRPPWRRETAGSRSSAVWCNICGWCGRSFLGHTHAESALCPVCGSIARDRFLFWCFISRCPRRPGLRVLETSPRLGHDYRAMMRRWYAYRCSDFDLQSHTADVALDLQTIDLPDRSVDVILTPHVLEHVPDTETAIREVHRILTRRGRVYVQVPLLQGTTAPPATPEYHADNTLVHWRFGWDLTDALRRGGFDVRVLVPAGFKSMLEQSALGAGESGAEFDLESILTAARPGDLEPVLTPVEAERLGIVPAYQFVVWECVRVGRAL